MKVGLPPGYSLATYGRLFRWSRAATLRQDAAMSEPFVDVVAARSAAWADYQATASSDSRADK